MRDFNQWSDFAKRNMSELDYLRQENQFLKENLEELKKRNIIDSGNKLTIHRLPILPGSISSFIIAVLTITNIYEIKSSFSNTDFLERFLYWNVLLIGCFLCYWFLYVILDLILEKLDKILSLGFYKKDNEFHWQKLIPFISYIIIMLIITVLGPQ